VPNAASRLATRVMRPNDPEHYEKLLETVCICCARPHEQRRPPRRGVNFGSSKSTCHPRLATAAVRAPSQQSNIIHLMLRLGADCAFGEHNASGQLQERLTVCTRKRRDVRSVLLLG
jgi:hypothetical protein